MPNPGGTASTDGRWLDEWIEGSYIDVDGRVSGDARMRDLEAEAEETRNRERRHKKKPPNLSANNDPSSGNQPIVFTRMPTEPPTTAPAISYTNTNSPTTEISALPTITITSSPTTIISFSPTATISSSPTATISSSPTATISSSPTTTFSYLPTTTISSSPTTTISSSLTTAPTGEVNNPASGNNPSGNPSDPNIGETPNFTILDVPFDFSIQTPAEGPSMYDLLNKPGSTFEQDLVTALGNLVERVVKDVFGDTTKAGNDGSTAGLRGLRIYTENHPPCINKSKRTKQWPREGQERPEKRVKRQLLVQYQSSNPPNVEFGAPIACPSGTIGQCSLVSATAFVFITNDEDPESVRERLVSAILKAIQNWWLNSEMENIDPNVKVRFTVPTTNTDDPDDTPPMIANPRTVHDEGLTVDEAVGIAVGCMVAIGLCNSILFMLYVKFLRRPREEETKEENGGLLEIAVFDRQLLGDAASSHSSFASYQISDRESTTEEIPEISTGSSSDVVDAKETNIGANNIVVTARSLYKGTSEGSLQEDTVRQKEVWEDEANSQSNDILIVSKSLEKGSSFFVEERGILELKIHGNEEQDRSNCLSMDAKERDAQSHVGDEVARELPSYFSVAADQQRNRSVDSYADGAQEQANSSEFVNSLDHNVCSPNKFPEAEIEGVESEDNIARLTRQKDSLDDEGKPLKDQETGMTSSDDHAGLENDKQNLTRSEILSQQVCNQLDAFVCSLDSVYDHDGDDTEKVNRSNQPSNVVGVLGTVHNNFGDDHEQITGHDLTVKHVQPGGQKTKSEDRSQILSRQVSDQLDALVEALDSVHDSESDNEEISGIDQPGILVGALGAVHDDDHERITGHDHSIEDVQLSMEEGPGCQKTQSEDSAKQHRSRSQILSRQVSDQLDALVEALDSVHDYDSESDNEEISGIGQLGVSDVGDKHEQITGHDHTVEEIQLGVEEGPEYRKIKSAPANQQDEEQIGNLVGTLDTEYQTFGNIDDSVNVTKRTRRRGSATESVSSQDPRSGDVASGQGAKMRRKRKRRQKYSETDVCFQTVPAPAGFPTKGNKLNGEPQEKRLSEIPLGSMDYLMKVLHDQAHAYELEAEKYRESDNEGGELVSDATVKTHLKPKPSQVVTNKEEEHWGRIDHNSASNSNIPSNKARKEGQVCLSGARIHSGQEGASLQETSTSGHTRTEAADVAAGVQSIYGLMIGADELDTRETDESHTDELHSDKATGGASSQNSAEMCSEKEKPAKKESKSSDVDMSSLSSEDNQANKGSLDEFVLASLKALASFDAESLKDE